MTTADQIQLLCPADMPRLRAVFLLHAGLNGLDAGNPLLGGVMLLNNSGAHSRKAGEYVLMAALMLVNEMTIYVDQQRRELWQSRLTPTLAGRRVSVVGVGGGAWYWRSESLATVRCSSHRHPKCPRAT